MLRIFRMSLKRGPLDRLPPGGGEPEIEQICPLDALFDTPEDIPARYRDGKRYPTVDGYTFQEDADAL